MQETDIQTVGYCLKKDKGVKTRTLVFPSHDRKINRQQFRL